MTGIVTTSAITLDTLAVEIRQQVDAAEDDLRSAVAHGIRAGELLIEAKEQIGHGGWLPWLQANFSGTVQTAASYMRMAKRRDEIEDASSIRGALAELARPAAAPAKEKTTGTDAPDRCDRCGAIVRSDKPHKCPAAVRRLIEARDALSLAYKDVRDYPRSSEADIGKCQDLAEACARLADLIGRRVAGEPEPDERQQRLDSAQRTIEGVGFAVCDCGSRLADYKGRPYCYGCSSYRDEDGVR